MAHTPNPDDLRRLTKTVPNRAFAEDIRRLALSMDDEYEAAALDRTADFLLDARQVLRGGRKNVRGSRHYQDD